MKLYAIANWSKLYENNRSRVVADLRWVPIPNKLDGEHFTAIMNHPDGATIFAGFVLLVEIASRCAPRGTLTRSNGQPHTPMTLAQKCRCPVNWFETALKYLETHTDWLLVTDGNVTSASRQRQVDDVVEASHPISSPSAPPRLCGESPFESLRNRISQLYSSGSGTATARRWSNYEEQMLSDLAQNGHAEFNLILRYRESLPPADRAKYFPQSVQKLLENWGQLLDRASLVPAGQPNNTNAKQIERMVERAKNL